MANNNDMNDRFLRLVSDEAVSNSVICCISSRFQSNTSNVGLPDVLNCFSGILSFSDSLNEWIHLQTQPFLSYKHINNIDETVDVKQNVAENLKSSILSNNLFIKQKKPKKRIIPVAVAPSKDFALQQPVEVAINNIDQSTSSPNTHLTKSKSVRLDGLGITVLISNRLLESSPTSTEDDNKFIGAKRLGLIFGTLIMYQFVPISSVIPYLSRIINTLVIFLQEGITLDLKYDDSSICHPLLEDSALLEFTISCIHTILPIICSIGGQFAQTFLRVTRPLHPLSDKFNTVVEPFLATFTDKIYDDLLSQGGTEFMRPFQEEDDSRHEFKSQIETNIYNERELCFDNFSNLFRQFREISCGDFDGTRIDMFWSNISKSGARILNLNECNFPWFAAIFKDMLVFYGANLGTTSSSFQSTSLMNASNSSVDSSYHLDKTNFKQRSLEERLGPGGKGQSSMGARCPPPIRQSFAMLRMKSMFLNLQDPSSSFPGDQQFFFRFLVIMDCFRLNVHLINVFFADILKLSNEKSIIDPAVSFLYGKGQSTNNGSKSNVSANPIEQRPSFALRVIKLRILGKFLGLLTFGPYWTVSISSLTEGPLVNMIRSSTSRRDAMVASTFPLCEILHNACREKRLCIVVPWVSCFLKMMFWDKYSLDGLMVGNSMYSSPNNSSSNYPLHGYASAFSILAAIQASPSYRLENGVISRNRFYVLLEIENLINSFPNLHSRLRKLSASHMESSFSKASSVATFEFESDVSSFLDDDNLALSKTFMIHVVPYLMESMHILQNKISLQSHRSRVSSVDYVDNGTAGLISTQVSVVSSRSSKTATFSILVSEFPSQSLSKGLKQFNAPEMPSISPVIGRSPSRLQRDRSVSAMLNNSDINSKLENSFWQRHPKYQQISIFVIEQLSMCCGMQARLRVAEMIRSAYLSCGQLTAGGEDSNMPSISIEGVLDQLFYDTHRQFLKFLDTFIEDNINQLLSNLFKMYPGQEQVKNMALCLILKHKYPILKTQMDFFNDYARKKIREVALSIAQKKAKASKNKINGKLSDFHFNSQSSLDQVNFLKRTENINLLKGSLNELVEYGILFSSSSYLSNLTSHESHLCNHIISAFCDVSISSKSFKNSQACSDLQCDVMFNALCTRIVQVNISAVKYMMDVISFDSPQSDDRIVLYLITNMVVILWQMLKLFVERKQSCVASDDAGKVVFLFIKIISVICGIMFQYDVLIEKFRSSFQHHFRERYNLEIYSPSHILIIANSFSLINSLSYCRIIGLASKPASIYGVGLQPVLYTKSFRSMILANIGKYVAIHVLRSEFAIDIANTSWIHDQHIHRALKRHCTEEVVHLLFQFMNQDAFPHT